MTTHLDDDLSEFDDLRLLMTRALDGVEVPVQRLTDRATGDGRRRRRRSRALTAVGGLAAAATVAVVVGSASGSGSGTTATDRGIATAPTRTHASTFVARPGFWDMPTAEVHARLEALLPQIVGGRRLAITSWEHRLTDAGPGESGLTPGRLTGTMTGKPGIGSFEVGMHQLSPADAGDPSQDFGCPPADWDPAATVRSCVTLEDAAGRPEGRQLAVELDGVELREVTWQTHGGLVRVATANSTQRKWGPPASAAEPPMTLAQLTQVAQSDTWTSWTPSGG